MTIINKTAYVQNQNITKAPKFYTSSAGNANYITMSMVDSRVQPGTPPYFKISTRGRSTSPIRNNSLFLRFHVWTIHKSKTSRAWTIHKSNLEHLLVLRLQAGTIHDSNPKQLLLFKAQHVDKPRVKYLPCVDNPQVQSGSPPFF